MIDSWSARLVATWTGDDSKVLNDSDRQIERIFVQSARAHHLAIPQAYRPGWLDQGTIRNFGHAYVNRWRGIRQSERTATGLDYVICQLNWRIGDRTGWMGSWYYDDEAPYYNGTWISVGYHDTESPQVEFAAQ